MHVRSEHNGLGLLVLLLALIGCGKPELRTEYGKRSGPGGGSSVNGTAVLAGMFDAAGCRVTTKRMLSPRLKNYDTVVWFPDDFSLPSDDAIDFFEEWLHRGHGRTLVYVGRDFDAAPEYWDTVLPETPAEQAVEVLRRRAQAEASYESRRGEMPADGRCRWFRAERDAVFKRFGSDPQRAPRPSGEWAERAAVEPGGLQVELRGRLKPVPDAEPGEFAGVYRTDVLLAADGEILAWRIRSGYWDDGQVIIVANGSFLLNLPLVPRAHRRLAGRLIGECRPRGRVAFLESGPDGVIVLDQEPGTDFPTGFEWLTIWPINVVSLHVLVLGLVAVFARLLVFGRPWELPPVPVSDFGKHIDALGRLLAATKNPAYARKRIEEFEERVQGDSAEPDRSRSAEPPPSNRPNHR